MVGREVYSLQWQNFQKYLNETFLQLRSDNDFCDVTLVSEDNEQIEAHKVVLSSCSPFFQQLLMKNRHSHPLLYMRSISPNMLFYILDFIYKGEVELMQDELDSFLKIAQELNLKGMDNFAEHSESFDTKNKIDEDDIVDIFTGKTGLEPINHAIPMMDLKLQDEHLNREKLKYNQELTHQSNTEPNNQTEEDRITIKSLLFKRFQKLKNGRAKCNICNREVSAMCNSGAQGHLKNKHKKEYATFQREKNMFWRTGQE